MCSSSLFLVRSRELLGGLNAARNLTRHKTITFCRHLRLNSVILKPKMPTNNEILQANEDCTHSDGGDAKRIKLSENVKLRFAKLSENAYTPTRGSKEAAGFDLYSAYDCIVPSKGKVIAKTDIQIELPDGCYGRVAPRSGLAAKHFIDVGAGVIDQDYRGNVGVVLFNFGSENFEVKKGDRIAQLILERIYIPDLEEVPTLSETDRGAGGFGSTGSN